MKLIETDMPEVAAEFCDDLLPAESPHLNALRQQPPLASPAVNLEPLTRQITLPLDIVNKGRFDKNKNKPTIHKGEGMDLPTYIRRGMALN